MQSRYYNPATGRFLNADGLISTGQGLLGSNMFAYCGNNPVNFLDSAGTYKVDIWEKMGFKYDGSMRDFRRLNQGLPPYEYERWLAQGGTIDTNYVERSSDGVSIIMDSATFVPEDQTEDYYISKLKENQSSSAIDDISFAVGAATLFIKSCPTIVSVGLFVIDAIDWFNNKAAEADLRAYEQAMNGGKGVLIVKWTASGVRYAGGSHVVYYSWDGAGDPFAK